MFSARFWWQWCWWWCGPTISLLSGPDSNSWTCLLESQMLRKYGFLSKSLHSRTWPDTLQSPPLRKAAGYACATVDESHCPGQRVMNFLEPAGFLQHAWISSSRIYIDSIVDHVRIGFVWLCVGVFAKYILYGVEWDLICQTKTGGVHHTLRSWRSCQFDGARVW